MANVPDPFGKTFTLQLPTSTLLADTFSIDGGRSHVKEGVDQGPPIVQAPFSKLFLVRLKCFFFKFSPANVGPQ